jgi:hypothetical protein
MSFFTKETITDECKHTAAEGLFALNKIKHNHSFRSMDCTSSVIRRLHEEKFSCGQTKRESIVVNVLAIAGVDKNISTIFYEDGLFDEFIYIANLSKTRMDEWNTNSQLLKGGLKYSRSCEVNVFVKKHTTLFGILFCHSWY